MTRLSDSQQQRSKTGQALLEFALVLPLLVLIVFGVLDLGRVFFATVALTNAAREGARYITLYPDDLDASFSGSKSAAVQEAGYSGIVISYGDVTVDCANVDDDTTACDSDLPATVTVSYNFNLVLGWILPSPIPISRSAVMVVP